MAGPGPADLAAYGSAALFLAFAVQRFAALRFAALRGNRRDRVSLYAGGFALCMAGGLVALAPSTLAAVSIGSTRELTLLLGDLLKTGAVGLLVLIALLLQGRQEDPAAGRVRLRRWLTAVIVVPCCLALLFWTSRITDQGQEFVVRGWRRWPLAAALEAARAGRRSGSATVTGVPQPVPGPGTVDAEAEWLIRVAAAFGTCAAVSEVRRRAAEALAVEALGAEALAGGAAGSAGAGPELGPGPGPVA